MTESLDFDLIICGSGLAGLRAAISASQKKPNIRIGIVSKVQVMRSHSVSAEGGTAAVIAEDRGDTIESHIYDTVKGSDFLADQDVAERLCKEMPKQIFQLDHWGMPWSREKDGRIAQRAFGGYSYARATYASDKVGFYEMQTLYDTCQKFENISNGIASTSTEYSIIDAFFLQSYRWCIGHETGSNAKSSVFSAFIPALSPSSNPSGV